MRIYSVKVYMDVALDGDGSEPELALAMDRIQSAVENMGEEGFSVEQMGWSRDD